MQERVITLATPVFFALIALELLWGWSRGRNTYRINDAVCSIGLGILSQVTGVFTRVLRVGIYALVFNQLALTRWPADAWWALPAALLFYDFCYYWYHRWGHRVAVFWAAHVVHHSSEDYNLSTALRQPSTGALLGWIPYLPMAVAGVPPPLFAAVALIDLLYQFWIHTEHVGRLGWFDRVFASPSNHRVHHAINDRYLDKNYGGILVLWDRLFGTFEPERDDDPVVYGTRTPLHSFNPLWANLSVYAELARNSLRLPRWRDRLQLWLRPPGWWPAAVPAAAAASGAPGDVPAAGLPPDRRLRFDPPAGRMTTVYALAQFALQLGCAVYFLDAQRTGALPALLACLAYITVSLVGIGGLLQGGAGWRWLEVARHALVLAMLGLSQNWFGLSPTMPDALRWLLFAMFATSLLAALRLRPNRVTAGV